VLYDSHPYRFCLRFAGHILKIYRQIIAALMLVIYAPTAVLAGAPLLVCQDATGHQQIEWRTTKTGHADIISHAAHEDSGQGVENSHSHDGGCVDRDVVSNSTLLSRLLAATSSLEPDTAHDQSGGDQTDTTGGVSGALFLFSEHVDSASVQHGLSLPYFQLLQLKTVVLRI
jgi:hypothetical protein